MNRAIRKYDQKPDCIGRPIPKRTDRRDAIESAAVLVVFFGTLLVGLLWDLI